MENKHFKFLADNSPLITWTATAEGKVDYCNKKWYDYTGMSTEEMLSLGWEPVLHPDDLAICREVWAQSLESQSSFTVEFRFLRVSDKTYRWHVARAFPMKDESGTTLKWLGTATDVEDQRKLLRLERQENAKLSSLNEAIINSSNYTIISTNLEGMIVSFNKAAEVKLGYRSEEVIGRCTPELIHVKEEVVKRAAELSEELKLPVKPGFDVFVIKSILGLDNEHEYTYVRKDGTTFPVHLSVSVLRDGEGQITGYLGVGVDITQQKNAERELHKAKENAEAASLFKTRFLANMSHEIRTPLNAIIGFAEVLKKQKPSNTQLDYLNHITSSGDLLLKLIGDILDLSKIEEGKLEIVQETFNIKEVLSSALFPYKFRAEERGVMFNINFNTFVPDYIIGDAYRIKQIIINLVGNALKFTHKGRIDVDVTNESAVVNPDTVLLKFSVTDTGIGINTNKIDSILEAFTQEDSSISRQYGGSGLGLSIVKELVDLMQGRIEIASPVNRDASLGGPGSSISFILPFQLDHKIRQPRKHEQRETSVLSHDIKVLVVEDNKMNQQLAEVVLQNLQCTMELANNGEEAIQKVATTKYSIILMDVSMPVMDGLTATQLIRNQYDREVPIIGLTANVYKEDIDQCLSSGMNDYLGKPYFEEDLYEMIKKWCLRDATVEEEEESSAIDFQYIDLTYLRSITSNVDFIREVLSAFPFQRDKYLAELNHSYEKDDKEEFRKVLRSFKTCVNIVGCKEMITVLEHMEGDTNLSQYNRFLKEVTKLSDHVNSELNIQMNLL